MLRHLLALAVCSFALAPLAFAQAPSRLPLAEPAAVGMDAKKLALVDAKIEETIKKGDLPGAVLLVQRQGKIVYRKAYGHKSKQPLQLAMDPNVVFDMASLTKPIATGTAIMILLEQGKLKLSDEVSKYLPAFDSKKKHKITIEQLLLHTSGLIPDNALADYQDGPKHAWAKLFGQEPITEPGSKFKYSDVNYILLGKIVEQVSGQSLDVFTRQHVFEPLELKDTTFKPDAKLAARAAPTEQRDGKWMQGEVHDPRAFLLGGVAGHAGLFSTADDLAVYVQMLLNKGEFGGKRILSADTVKLMTTPRPVPGGQRTLGWDANTAFSTNRGELFPIGGFGHTGFTGTSVWVDPGSQTAVILLSNRVHPNGKGNVVKLRSQVATLVAASIINPPLPKVNPAPKMAKR